MVVVVDCFGCVFFVLIASIQREGGGGVLFELYCIGLERVCEVGLCLAKRIGFD